jgi:hypothetical protein
MTWKQCLLTGVVMGSLAGPVVLVVAAELALMRGHTVPFLQWEHWASWPLLGTALVFRNWPLGWALVAAVVAGTIMVVRITALRTWLGYVLAVLAFFFVAGLSFLFTLYPFLDCFYDRYRRVIPNATTWADHYSEDRFSQVAIGMTMAQVTETAGLPLWRDGQQWGYSQIGHYQTRAEKGYHQRLVVFRDGIVIEVRRRYVPGDASQSF